MSYNLKCCSFYPNNFDASALTPTEVHTNPDRGTHVPRPRYAYAPTETSIRGDRNAATCQPQQPIIHYLKKAQLFKAVPFLFYLKPVQPSIRKKAQL